MRQIVIEEENECQFKNRTRRLYQHGKNCFLQRKTQISFGVLARFQINFSFFLDKSQHTGKRNVHSFDDVR